MIDQITEAQEHTTLVDKTPMTTIADLKIVKKVRKLDDGSFIVTRKPLDLGVIKEKKMTVMYWNCPTDCMAAVFASGIAHPIVSTGKISGAALCENDKLDYFLFGPAICKQFTKVIATSLQGQWQQHIEKHIRKAEIKLFAIRGTMDKED